MKKPKATTKLPAVRLAHPAGRPIQIRYTCPIEKREIRISTNTYDAAAAEEQRKDVEAKLRVGMEAKPKRSSNAGPSMLWEDFREEYTRLKVPTFRSETARESAEYRLDICEGIIKPRTLGQMAAPDTLAKLQAELLAGIGGNRKDEDGNPLPRSPHTVRSYLGALIAALNWAHRPMRWLPTAVEFDMLDCDDPDKGRPLCAEEFERMLAAVPKAIDAKQPETVEAAVSESWRYLLRGLWESGLRLSEAMALTWDDEAGIVPHFPRRGLPYLSIPAKLQKSRKAQDVPTTPAFASLLLATPEAARTGYVFNPLPRRGKGRLVTEQVGRIIGLIGERANIVVSASGKTASAHDLRRSFGQRMADAGLPPRDLQAIMRHASFTTTEQYYLRDRVQDQAERIAKYLGTGATKAATSQQEEIAASA